jgi:hypothetical protein
LPCCPSRNLIELFFRCTVAIRFHLAEQGAVFDDEQVLSETIVQFGGNAFVFVFLRFDQVARSDSLKQNGQANPTRPFVCTESAQLMCNYFPSTENASNALPGMPMTPPKPALR